MFNKLIIYGIGDYAKQMLWYFSNDSQYTVIGFCVDEKFFDKDLFCNLPVYSFENLEKTLQTSNLNMFIAIGYSNMRARKRIFEKAKSKNIQLINYISSKAIIAQNCILGCNNAILAGVVIEPNSHIEDNNVIWSNSTICHDTKIGSHNFIAAGTIVGGNTIIHNLCFIGFRSTIIQNLEIYDETLIGASSLQLQDSKEATQWLGSPSKLISYHSNEGIKIK